MEHIISLTDLRNRLGYHVDLAHHRDEVTVITVRNEPRAVLISHQQYQQLVAGRDDAPTGVELDA